MLLEEPKAPFILVGCKQDVRQQHQNMNHTTTTTTKKSTTISTKLKTSTTTLNTAASDDLISFVSKAKVSVLEKLKIFSFKFIFGSNTPYFIVIFFLSSTNNVTRGG